MTLLLCPVNDVNGYAERETNGAGIGDGRAKMVDAHNHFRYYKFNKGFFSYAEQHGQSQSSGPLEEQVMEIKQQIRLARSQLVANGEKVK